jgi:hypothetical protein
MRPALCASGCPPGAWRGNQVPTRGGSNGLGVTAGPPRSFGLDSDGRRRYLGDEAELRHDLHLVKVEVFLGDLVASDAEELHAASF